MSEDGNVWLKLMLAILATWRLTHLLAREDGPADLIARARLALGDGFWGRMLDCFYCLSLWVAAPITLWITTTLPDAVLVWLAISGAACLCDRIGQPDVVLQPLPESSPLESSLESSQAKSESKEKGDGMLRTKT